MGVAQKLAFGLHPCHTDCHVRVLLVIMLEFLKKIFAKTPFLHDANETKLASKKLEQYTVYRIYIVHYSMICYFRP